MLERHPKYLCLSAKRGRIFSPPLLKVGWLFFLVIQLACSPAVQIIHKSSSPQKPKWITTLPLSADTLYFVGINSSAENLEDGQISALKNAMSKISNHLGSKIKSEFNEYTTEIEHELKQQISTKSSATIHGATIEDLYYEKIIRKEKNFEIEKYDVYLLVSLSKDQAKKEMERQRKEIQQKAQVAFNFYQKGRTSEQQNRYYEAKRFYQRALKTIDDLEEIITLNNQDTTNTHNITNSENLKLSLQSQLQKVKSRLAQVTIDFTVDGPPQADQTFLANFTSALTQKGFTATEQNPSIKITGQIFTKKSNALRNRYSYHNYVYYAQGGVSATRTSDNQKIAAYSFQVKGFHRIKEQAALNALAEAGTDAGNRLAKIILEKQMKR